MRRSLALLLLALLALSLAPSAQGAATFVITGRGWGHGIGMSQYGAEGFAQHGWTYDQILAHYYRGTTLGPAPLARVRVLLAENRGAVEIASAADFTVTDGRGRSFAVAAGAHRLGPDLRLRAEGQMRALASPLRFEAGGAPLELGRPYRGALVVSSTGRSLQVVNDVALEAYLYGVVPGEMPAGWESEALRTQAVAARSYALASIRPGGAFDLHADTRSQVYGGIDVEDPRTNEAVDATAGQVVLYEGAVAQTFFFSTSGGRTAAVADEWPGAAPAPYLVSVEDPYDDISPFHTWGPVVFSGGDVARRLGAPRKFRDLVTELNPSRRVATVAAVGAEQTAELTGAAVRTALGLRSTWFEIGVLSLLPAQPRVIFGESALLAGVVRGLDGVTLERRPAGGAWEAVGPVEPGSDGAFEQGDRPRVTTWYRLVAGEVRGPVVRLGVSARVNFLREQTSSALAGRVRPKVAGARVEIQRLEDGRWPAVASALTAADGSFAAELPVMPGLYRAVARVGRGLAPGVSPVLTIVSG